MSVWVDGCRRWHHGDGRQWCHLAASSVEEMQAFARGMGWPEHWLHDGRYPHYDLVPSQRARAVAAGAIEVCPRTMIRNLRRAAGS